MIIFLKGFMMSGIGLLVVLFVAVVLLIVSISKWKIHPFLALMGIALLLALVAGIPLLKIPKIIGSGFSGIFSSIGIVIIFGALIGYILEKTKAALKLADVVVQKVGKKKPELAVVIMGWVVSIPVFCDSGYVILSPIRRAMQNKMKIAGISLSVALAGGLYVSHVFIPPTPGPIAAAGMLGIADNLLMVIVFGVLVSIPCLIVAYLFARKIGKQILIEDELGEVDEAYQSVIETKMLPSTFDSFAPIIMPIIFMALGSILAMAKASGFVADLFKFFGTPIIALAIGLLFAINLLRKTSMLKEFYNITNTTLQVVGPILFITAAGAVLGKVIAAAGFADFIKENATNIQSIGIFFPFVVAAILKTAQGSSTVAIITTAGILGAYNIDGGVMYSLGFTTPLAATLVVMAIGAGAMTVSHANDSYFWVVTKFGGINAQNGYKSHTLNTLLMGVAGIVFIWILSLVLI